MTKNKKMKRSKKNEQKFHEMAMETWLRMLLDHHYAATRTKKIKAWTGHTYKHSHSQRRMKKVIINVNN